MVQTGTNGGWLVVDMNLWRLASYLALRLTPVLFATAVPLAVAGLFVWSPGLEVSHAGTATNGAMAVDCDADTVGVQAACAYRSGSPFSVEIWITQAPTPSGFFGFQAKLRWDDALISYLPTDDPDDEVLLQDCYVSARFENEPLGDPSVLLGCVPLPLQQLLFVGPVLEFDFQCRLPGGTPDQAALQLISRQDDPDQFGTHFIDGNLNPIDPALTGATVTCDEPPPPEILAVDCDAITPGVQNDCAFGFGSDFLVQIHVVWPPQRGYFGFQTKLGWVPEILTYVPTSNPAGEAVWDRCNVPARTTSDPPDPFVLWACVPFPRLTEGNTTIGAVSQFRFYCAAQDTNASQIGAGSDEPTLELAPLQGDPQLGSHFLDQNFEPVDAQVIGATVVCLANADTDGDGCTAEQEQGPDPRSGGRRSPSAFWDFFDTPNDSNVRDGAITAGDLARVVQRFGASDTGAGAFDRASDPLSAPDPPVSPSSARANYHPAFDRSPAPPALSGPADGIIATGDIALIVRQFGHSCVGSAS